MNFHDNKDNNNALFYSSLHAPILLRRGRRKSESGAGGFRTIVGG